MKKQGNEWASERGVVGTLILYHFFWRIFPLLPWLTVGIFFPTPLHLNRNDWIVLAGLCHGIMAHQPAPAGNVWGNIFCPLPTVYAGVSFADASFLERTGCFCCWALDYITCSMREPRPLPHMGTCRLSWNTTSTDSYNTMVSVLV